MRDRLGILIFLGLGLGFLLIGGVLAIFGSSAARADAVRADRLPAITTSGLESQAVGSEVLVEGKISSRNQPQFHSFVAYIREEYQGVDESKQDSDNEEERERWSEDQHITPPILLEVADGPIQVANSDYRFESAPSRWQESGMLHESTLLQAGTKRYFGFEANDPALAIGTVVDTNEGHAIQAEFIYGGNRTDYIAGQRSSATVMRWIGIGFSIAGAVLLAFGARMFFKPKPVVKDAITDEEFFGENIEDDTSDEDEADEEAKSESAKRLITHH